MSHVANAKLLIDSYPAEYSANNVSNLSGTIAGVNTISVLDGESLF